MAAFVQNMFCVHSASQEENISIFLKCLCDVKLLWQSSRVVSTGESQEKNKQLDQISSISYAT